jgi:protoporphyrinogen IX oxidase
MALYYFKAFHIIGGVAWFAGLFYLVRIFVYHIEANQKDVSLQSHFKDQYVLMEQRTYKIICNPAMMITWFCGLSMTILNPAYWSMPWFQFKIVVLILLTCYHLWTKSMIKKLSQDQQPYTSFQFRLLNELPTIFLLTIVLLAVLRDTLNFFYALGGVLVFAVLLYVIAKIYKTRRG